MKRRGNLWARLVGFANLLRAARQAERGKRFRPPVLAFHAELEHELCRLEADLRARTYRPGPYRTFHIHEPKKRLISAAPYRDRVVHHALVNVLAPVWERCFLPDSYACRQGKGTHAAMRRCQHFARRHRWAWKADVARYFPSIDHAVLKELLARRVKDPDVLGLAGLLIDHSNPQEEVPALFPGDDLFTLCGRRRGLPLGNQTSQFFANVYLDPLDHFLKDRLGLPGYVRYVDDFVAFADDRRTLLRAREQVCAFLQTLRLRLHPTKDAVFPVSQGIRILADRCK
jgi:retron-type reverse transcriptase